MLRLVSTVISFYLLSGTGATTTPKCTRYTDTFDAKLNPISALLPQFAFAGIQNGLQYTGAVIAGEGLASLIPASEPNFAPITLVQAILQTGRIGLSTFGTISGTPAAPLFDLEQVYFGCVVDLHTGAVALPTACDVNVKGFDKDGYEVEEKQISFKPGVKVKAPMQLESFSKFKKLQNVTFTLISATLGTQNTVLGLDNVTHCNY